MRTMVAAGEVVSAEAVWVLPDEPVPVRLMNTVWADRHAVHDALRTRQDLAGWVAATGLTAGPVTDGDVEAFRRLRDALRRLAALLTDDPRPAAASPLQDLARAVETVNHAASAGPTNPRLRLRASQLQRDDTPGGPGAALATVASQAVVLLTDATSAPLSACHAPGCVLYFVKDHPRRGWCSTACGNRVRAARHYQRRRFERTTSAATGSRAAPTDPTPR